jgi:hypothetical protein
VSGGHHPVEIHFIPVHPAKATIILLRPVRPSTAHTSTTLRAGQVMTSKLPSAKTLPFGETVPNGSQCSKRGAGTRPAGVTLVDAEAEDLCGPLRKDHEVCSMGP